MITFSYSNPQEIMRLGLGSVSILTASYSSHQWEFVGNGNPPTSWEANGYPVILIPSLDDIISFEFQPRRPDWPYGPISEGFRSIGDDPSDDYIVRDEKSVEHTNFDGWLKLAGPDVRNVTERIGYIQRIGSSIRFPVIQFGYSGVGILFEPGINVSDTIVSGKTTYHQRYRCDYIRGAFDEDPNTWCLKLEVPVYAGRFLSYHYVYCVQVGKTNSGKLGWKWKRWNVGDDGGAFYDALSDSPWPSPPYGGTLDVQYLTYSGVPVDPFKAKKIVSEFIETFDSYLNYFDLPNELDVYGELANSCTQQYKRIDANVPSTALETIGAADEILDLIQSVKDVFHAKSCGRFIQALGNLRLSLKWGLPLTIDDLTSIQQTTHEDIKKGRYLRDPDGIIVARRAMTRSCQGRGLLSRVTAEVRWNLKTIVKDSSVAQEHQFARLMADYNLISLENAWDMVPYSFVVDWVTQFGDCVQATDSLLYRLFYHQIVGSVRGRRVFMRLDQETVKRLEPRLIGEVNLVLYRRVASHTIPLPTCGFLTPEVGFTQMVDGSTLVGQQLTK